jgi:hypothetical protein
MPHVYSCLYPWFTRPVALIGWEWNLRDAWLMAERGDRIILA